MKHDAIMAEAKRLYDLGFAIHWLHPKSKRPVESGWTTGPRKDWGTLEKTYKAGFNVGVRLGKPSKINNNFLAVVDVDVKSKDEKHLAEVKKIINDIVPTSNLPIVDSGRGNGSQHYYVLTTTPLKPKKIWTSPEMVKVHMPSASPSKREKAMLTPEELKSGVRLRPAAEVAIMGEGQQVVLPPSVHPDSGKNYAWRRMFNGHPEKYFVDLTNAVVENPVEKSGPTTKPPQTSHDFTTFEPQNVDLGWLPVNPKIIGMIQKGEGVEDRSAALLPVAFALHKAGLDQNEILSILTNKNYFLGATAYDHAKTNDRQRAAAWLYKYTLKKVLDESNAINLFREPRPESKPVDEVEQQEIFDDLHHWSKELDLTKEGKKRGTLKNVVILLKNLVGQDLFKRNLFASRDFYGRGAPWGASVNAAITDEDTAQIKHWLGETQNVEPSKDIISDAISIMASRNSFDPVLDWLNALPAWDEVPRLDTWLRDNFQAQGDEDYLAQVFRKWLCAMVMRVKSPGLKFDWMPIFEGKQGAGKSSFGRLLVGDEYFLDWLPDLADKDSALALQGIWAVELGELASLRKNEIETVKAFVTRTVDKVRPPYGHRWLESPRRCVFFGTTNFDTYLMDESGNRRFKPVKVGKLNFEALKEERIQLFAEALWLINAGFETEHTLEICGDAVKYELKIQSDKMIQDESALMLNALFDFIQTEKKKPKEDQRFNFLHFKMRDLFAGGSSLFTGGSPLQDWKFDARNARFAGKALKALGAEKKKSNGVEFWVLAPKDDFRG